MCVCVWYTWYIYLWCFLFFSSSLIYSILWPKTLYSSTWDFPYSHSAITSGCLDSYYSHSYPFKRNVQPCSIFCIVCFIVDTHPCVYGKLCWSEILYAWMYIRICVQLMNLHAAIHIICTRYVLGILFYVQRPLALKATLQDTHEYMNQHNN